MDTLPVILIFVVCICLLLCAYLATTFRCYLWCLRGLKAKLNEPSNDMAFSTVTVVDGLAGDVEPVTEIETAAEMSAATETNCRISIEESTADSENST